MYCGERSIVKYSPTSRQVASLTCRSWGCPDCAPQRQARLIAEAHGGAPTIFLTLTSRRREGLTAEQAALRLTRAWRLVRLRLMRHYGVKKLPFIAVMEATKNRWPHLHILLRSRWLDHALISAWMKEIDDSPIVDIRKIDNAGRVKAYIAKYCSKASHKFGSAKRYYKSRDYELRSDAELSRFQKKQPGWLQSEKHIRWWGRLLQSQGFSIEWLSPRRIVATVTGPP